MVIAFQWFLKMKKTEDFNKYRNFFIKALIIGGIIFSGVFFLYPRAKEIPESRRAIAEEKEKLAKLTQKAEFLESLDENELANKTQFLLKVLPPEKDVVLIISSLKALCAQLNLQIDSFQINLSGESSSSGLSSISFSLRIVGDKEGLNNLIERIKTTYPLIDLEGLDISLEEGNLLQATIKIKAFFLELPKEMGKTENPLPLINPEEEKFYYQVSNFTSPLLQEASYSVPLGKENPFTL